MPTNIFAPLTPPIDAQEVQGLTKKKDLTAQLASQHLVEGYNGLCRSHNALVGLVNDNPFKLTPKQAAAALGPMGGALLAIAVKVKEVVEVVAKVSGRNVDADLSKPKEGVSYDVGEGGSIVVTEQE